MTPAEERDEAQLHRAAAQMSLLGLLVLDLGYSEGAPGPSAPQRHQLAWQDATRGLSPAQVRVAVARFRGAA
jgi:hypothetical protein